MRKPKPVINSEKLAIALNRRLGNPLESDPKKAALALELYTLQLQDALRETGLTVIRGKFTND